MRDQHLPVVLVLAAARGNQDPKTACIHEGNVGEIDDQTRRMLARAIDEGSVEHGRGGHIELPVRANDHRVVGELLTFRFEPHQRGRLRLLGSMGGAGQGAGPRWDRPYQCST